MGVISLDPLPLAPPGPPGETKGPWGSLSAPVPGVARAPGPSLWWQNRPSEEVGSGQAPECLEAPDKGPPWTIAWAGEGRAGRRAQGPLRAPWHLPPGLVLGMASVGHGGL